MSQGPLVDVVVVTWNTAELTATALRHLLDNPQGAELRVLVHDNASSDGTPEHLEQSVPEAEVVRGDSNLGFAGGVNRVLERSRAPWVFLLNSDAWPDQGAIGRLVETALRQPRAGLVVPRIERPDGSLEHSTHPFPSPLIALTTAYSLDRLIGARASRRLMLEPYWGHDSPRVVDWAVGAAWLLRRDALDAAGPLDERFFMYAEDIEWCWRARRRGWQVYFEPEARVRHVGNASGERRYADRRTIAYLRNTYRFYDTTHGAVARIAYRRLNWLGARRRAASAERNGDQPLATYWREIAAVHREPTWDHDAFAQGGSS